jgi:hypothetical protein
MAVYMQGSRRHRITVAVGAATLVIGFGIGYLVGHGGATSAGDVAAAARSKGEDAATALQRLPIEYEQAVASSSGESATTITEAIDQAASLLDDAFAAAPWMGPAMRQPSLDATETLRQDVAAKAPPETFSKHVTDAVSAIETAFNLPASIP